MWRLCESPGRRDGWPCGSVVCGGVADRASDQRPAGAVVGQPERAEPTQVERGGAVAQPVVVFGHATIANLAPVQLFFRSAAGVVVTPWRSETVLTPAPRYPAARWYRPRSYTGSSAPGCLPGGRRVATGGVGCAAGGGGLAERDRITSVAVVRRQW